jgi:hypothetical protein
MKTLLAFILFFSISVNAQELFPLNEAASTVPKGVIGVRIFGESFKEINTQRNMGAIRLMYGLTPKLSIYLSTATSNHHGNHLPSNLITHTHIGNQTYYFAQSTTKGVVYPYRFNGFYFFAKYRFLTIDGEKKHLRIAAYGEYSNVKQAHDEAEPNLLDDTKGYGGGLIITMLKNRFAASLTTGVIIPGSYEETVPVGNGSILYNTTKINYGRAVKYNLSFGYLLYPKNYENYSQNNWNIYLEFIGKSYEAATVFQNGQQLDVESLGLKAGNYMEVHPGIQKIINSNLRIDASVGFNMINKSYTRFYPMYMLGIQRYFFQNNKSKKMTALKQQH